MRIMNADAKVNRKLGRRYRGSHPALDLGDIRSPRISGSWHWRAPGCPPPSLQLTERMVVEGLFSTSGPEWDSVLVRTRS